MKKILLITLIFILVIGIGGFVASDQWQEDDVADTNIRLVEMQKIIDSLSKRISSLEKSILERSLRNPPHRYYSDKISALEQRVSLLEEKMKIKFRLIE